MSIVGLFGQDQSRINRRRGAFDHVDAYGLATSRRAFDRARQFSARSTNSRGCQVPHGDVVARGVMQSCILSRACIRATASPPPALRPVRPAPPG